MTDVTPDPGDDMARRWSQPPPGRRASARLSPPEHTLGDASGRGHRLVLIVPDEPRSGQSPSLPSGQAGHGVGPGSFLRVGHCCG
jgi:hypothetical protein